MAEAIAVLRGAVVRHPAPASTRDPARDRIIGPLDLTIAAGEIVALVGASGAGKSTALRLLAGLETPTDGEVRLAAGVGRTGFVFQNPTLAPWADALANVALPLELGGLSGPEARRRAAQALDAVGLGDRLSAMPHELSGGMAMRASLARALAPEPDLLLLDEPFAALDSVTRRRLIEDLHGLWSARRPAIVFVTHDVEEAVYVAGRTVLLAADGRATMTIASPGDLPRPPRWRLDPAYRQTVETVADALTVSMGAVSMGAVSMGAASIEAASIEAGATGVPA